MPAVRSREALDDARRRVDFRDTPARRVDALAGEFLRKGFEMTNSIPDANPCQPARTFLKRGPGALARLSPLRKAAPVSGAPDSSAGSVAKFTTNRRAPTGSPRANHRAWGAWRLDAERLTLDYKPDG